jgi:hypothetical protein
VHARVEVATVAPVGAAATPGGTPTSARRPARAGGGHRGIGAAAIGCPRPGCSSRRTARGTTGSSSAGPRLTLIAAIDDATGILTAATFREQEDAPAYLTLLRDTIRRHGVPLALYRDRHGICDTPKRQALTLVSARLSAPERRGGPLRRRCRERHATGSAPHWMARPEGTERAVQTLEIDGVGELVAASGRLNGSRSAAEREQVPGFGDALELMLASVDEMESGSRDEVLDGARHEHLARARER